MKKKLLSSVVALGFSMMFMPNVFAAVDCNDVDNSTWNEALTTCSEIKLKETINLSTYSTINRTITIDLNGKNITSTTNKTVLYVNGSSGNLTLTGSGSVVSNVEGNAPVFIGNGATINIEGNVIIENDNSDGSVLIGQSSTINIDDNATIKGSSTGVSIDGDNSKLNIKGGKVSTTGNSITVFGNNPIVNITGGNIVSTTGFALSGNGSKTINSKITISNGSLKSDSSSAIYNPQSGTLDISGGDISGKIGIVARQGKINVTGGKITATGTEELSIGDAGVNLPGGVAVIIDNTEDYGKGKLATATIGGSTIIKATNTNPVLSYGKEDNKDNEILISDGVTFTGTTPKVSYLVEGVKLNSNGKVVSNKVGSVVSDEVTSDTSDEVTSNEANDKDDVPKTGNSLPMALFGIMALISVIGIVNLKLSLNKE